MIDVESWLASQRPGEAPSGRLRRGAKVGGWRVEAFLGRGLSAEVYRVTSVRFGYEGALKLLVDGSRGLGGRFAAEADALRFLSLPHLPRFMDSGSYEGAPYYVMEHLQPLPDPMPQKEIPRFMRRVALAVQELHNAGYIHRDLKPGNILRRADGDCVLIDLGLAKKRGTRTRDPVVRHGKGLSTIDGKPVGVGTLDYAAPEQLLKGEASVASDVFALGKILRALYDGRPPANIKRIIRTATREAPGDRYSTAAEFAAALGRRNLVRWAAAACAAVVLAVLAVVAANFREIRAWAAARFNPPPRILTIGKGADESEADYFVRLAAFAEGGNAVAQCALAEAYMFGQGTTTNQEKAVHWYRIAAEAGNADAQASLGLCLLRGKGCAKDVPRAVDWYRRAVAQGNLSAMSDLAFCMMNGIGCEKDPKGAFELALGAAKCGHAPAQAFVGECYLEGRGVERDAALAETWLFRAARLGNSRARMLLETR